MGIGVSVFLIAVGAILAFAVNISSSGLDLNTIGVILMVVGGIGLFAALAIGGFGDWGGVGGYRRTTMVDDGPDVVVERRPRRVVRREYLD